jgi:hypothetical protein
MGKQKAWRGKAADLNVAAGMRIGRRMKNIMQVQAKFVAAPSTLVQQMLIKSGNWPTNEEGAQP